MALVWTRNRESALVFARASSAWGRMRAPIAERDLSPQQIEQRNALLTRYEQAAVRMQHHKEQALKGKEGLDGWRG